VVDSALVASRVDVAGADGGSCRRPIGELGRLSALLGALHARGRIERALPLYLTEYGYETNPPDRTRGVSERTQARYHGLATFLAWQRPDVRMFSQFLVRDIGPVLRFAPGSAARFRDFQTGLFDFRGRAKPAVRAFRVPFWAYRDGADAVLFGQVRPGNAKHQVRIEREAGGHPHQRRPATRLAANGRLPDRRERLRPASNDVARGHASARTMAALTRPPA